MKALPVKVTNPGKSLLITRVFKDPVGEAIIAPGETLTFEFRDLAHDFKERLESLGATVVVQVDEAPAAKTEAPKKPDTKKEPEPQKKAEEVQKPADQKQSGTTKDAGAESKSK